jgi:hypothetical protein
MDGWSDEQIAHLHAAYCGMHGTKHPERGIDLATFQERLKSFESLIDPWITGEGSRESSVRKWCKDAGLKTAAGRGSFSTLFSLVDAIHPVT